MYELIDYEDVSPRDDLPKTDYYMKEIENIVENYEFAQLELIGRSQGIPGIVDPQDVYLLDFIPEKGEEGVIFVVGGHHATEPAGPEAALSFAKKYAESDTELARYMKEHIRVSVIPVVSVDMYSLEPESRGYDQANQQYNRLSSAFEEIKAVANAVFERIEGSSYLLSFDFHETPDDTLTGFAMFENIPEGWTGDILGELAINSLRDLGYSIYGADWDTPGRIYSKTPECFDGFSAGLGAYSFTFETPGSNFHSRISMEDRVRMDLIAIDTIISAYFSDKL